MTRSSHKPTFDALEDRTVPATATFSNGILTVLGTTASETIRVTQDSTRITVEGAGYVAASSVRGITIDAKAGNDTIDLRTVRVGATIYGGDGDDFIVATTAADSIFAGYGNDRVWGIDGADGIYGEAGNDKLFGGVGYDTLIGGDGSDFLEDGDRGVTEYADGGNGLDWNADVVAVNGTRMEDIKQTNAPTCGFLSSLAGLARLGTNFTQWVKYAGFNTAGTPQYDVAFWTGSAWKWTRVDFDGTLNNLDPVVTAEGESWVLLMQRAWIQYHGNGGRTWPHEAILALNGVRAAAQYSIADADFNRIATAVAQNRLVVAATKDAALSTGLVVRNHAYTVVQTWNGGNGNVWVQVRNPWGYDGAAQIDGDANDGLVWLQWSTFKANMGYLAVC